MENASFRSSKKATAKYEKENYDKILVRFPKGIKEKIINTGTKSINSFIIQAVYEKLEKDMSVCKESSVVEQSQELEKRKQQDNRYPSIGFDEIQKIIEQKRAEQGIAITEDTPEEREKRKKLVEIQAIIEQKKSSAEKAEQNDNLSSVPFMN
ncbi:MAG: hypothetical protein IJN54_06855 [Lachnospiraceae bacterium]|nr:hypothetical protein [Lachnospiraceae bacterium]